MYITKAIETAKILNPDEYTVEEYIMWCNELSCDLFLNYDKKFKTLTTHSGGEIALPENVTIYMIEKITVDGREIKKTDLYDFANLYTYSVRGRNVLKVPSGSVSCEVVYQEPYTPIRCIDCDVSVTASGNMFSCEDIGIYAGDTLTVKTDSSEYEIHVISISDDGYRYSGNTLPGGTYNCNIKRLIQEKTVCDAPFDYMYIDFLIAKSCLYSGNSNGYSNHIAAYSAKLAEYASFISRRKGHRTRKFINWY